MVNRGGAHARVRTNRTTCSHSWHGTCARGARAESLSGDDGSSRDAPARHIALREVVAPAAARVPGRSQHFGGAPSARDCRQPQDGTEKGFKAEKAQAKEGATSSSGGIDYYSGVAAGRITPTIGVSRGG